MTTATKRRARGVTGSVRGVAPDSATRMMMEACRRLWRDRKLGGFQRVELVEACYEVTKRSDEVASGEKQNVAEGLALQIERTPGVLTAQDQLGEYVLASGWEMFVAFRLWRFALGQVDAYEACVLLDLMDEKLERYGDPPRLATLRERLEAAVAGLKDAQ